MKINCNYNMDKKIFMFLYGLTTKNEALRKLATSLSKMVPIAVMVFYYFIMAYLILCKNIKVILYVAAPLVTLLAVTLLRNSINRPRPFDELDIHLLAEHSSGNSFPSRHASSAFIIAMAILSVNKPIGVILLILAFIICLTRILTGVHYPSDVTFGAVIGIVIGYLVYF